MSNEEAVMIYAAILEQAVSDYRHLLKKNKMEIKHKDAGKYGRQEIEDFFLSEWGESIIQDGLRLKRMSGTDFLRAASV